MDSDIRQLLITEAQRINSPAFIADDPVQFPRRFESLADIEIAALLSATIAWGNRRMICRDCERMLALMEYRPMDYVMDAAYEELDDRMNLHRTFFASNFKHYLRGLRAIYEKHGSLREFARAHDVHLSETPAWKLAEAINGTLAEANCGTTDCRCLPLNLDTTALKRLNMMLRWLVRDDGIVDMGVWRNLLDPSQLFIPLDVHVAATARELGLLTRRSNDKKAVLELTDTLRAINPADPAIFDYALFGIGMRL